MSASSKSDPGWNLFRCLDSVNENDILAVCKAGRRDPREQHAEVGGTLAGAA